MPALKRDAHIDKTVGVRFGDRAGFGIVRTRKEVEAMNPLLKTPIGNGRCFDGGQRVSDNACNAKSKKLASRREELTLISEFQGHGWGFPAHAKAVGPA